MTVLQAPSITKPPPGSTGAVLISGSHGGVYPGFLAARARVRGVIFNDAGVGKDQAGIGSLVYLQNLDIPAATVDHRTARIGDCGDMLAHGRISRFNAPAARLGVDEGMTCAAAARRLERAPLFRVDPPVYPEARVVLRKTPRRLVLIDSASLVEADDRGGIVVTGSHGGIFGNDPAVALRVEALAALFNDAGIGKDGAGITRLPALDQRGIAAATVAAMSARIGEARSTLEDGVLSRVNERAAALGAQPGMAARAFVMSLLGS